MSEKLHIHSAIEAVLSRLGIGEATRDQVQATTLDSRGDEASGQALQHTHCQADCRVPGQACQQCLEDRSGAEAASQNRCI